MITQRIIKTLAVNYTYSIGNANKVISKAVIEFTDGINKALKGASSTLEQRTLWAQWFSQYSGLDVNVNKLNKMLSFGGFAIELKELTGLDITVSPKTWQSIQSLYVPTFNRVDGQNDRKNQWPAMVEAMLSLSTNDFNIRYNPVKSDKMKDLAEKQAQERAEALKDLEESRKPTSQGQVSQTTGSTGGVPEIATETIEVSAKNSLETACQLASQLTADERQVLILSLITGMDTKHVDSIISAINEIVEIKNNATKNTKKGIEDKKAKRLAKKTA